MHATNSNEHQNDTENISIKNIILKDFTQLHPFSKKKKISTSTTAPQQQHYLRNDAAGKDEKTVSALSLTFRKFRRRSGFENFSSSFENY